MPDSATIRIWVNGATREVPASLTLTGLLAHLEIQAPRVAVERNREIVPRRRFDETRLEEGDRLEVVTFVGGG